MTTGIQRLQALSSGQPADRIPVFCNLIDQGAIELGIPLNEYYRRGDCVAEAQLRMREKYGYDNLWSLFYVGKEAELMGCKQIIFSADGPPNVGDMVIKTPADIEALEVPESIEDHPAFAEPLKCLEILRREAGGKYPICAYVTASMSLPAILMGMEKWLQLLFSGPPALRDELLEKCTLMYEREVAAYRKAGADVILYSNPFGSTDILPLSMIERLSMKWMRRDLQASGIQNVVYYCGAARLQQVIDLVIERLGLRFFYLGPQDDIAACKRIAADRAVCAGVINDIRLIGWSVEEIRAEVRRILQAGMPGGKFMFGTVLMPLAIPEENIRAMLAAAYEFGAQA